MGLVVVLAVALSFHQAAGAPAAEPSVPIPGGPEIISRLKKGHPRLIAVEADFARLKGDVQSQPILKKWHERLIAEGQKLLDAPPSKYEIPDGKRLLATSRRVLGRVQTLGLLYRLDGWQQWRDRAWKELAAAAAFTNWNPRHFLDTAEMTHAFAIGYDWLYDAWTPEQRKMLREAMVEKGIKLAMDVQRKTNWWARVRHNWNQVCNGGIGMGALAIGDEEPELCGEFLAHALKSIQLAMAEFAPDGAWAEGPGYWSYATTYNVALLAALQTAIGTDYGLSRMPGFAEAGTFPLFMSGPFGLSFNYADAHAGTIRAPHLYWMARQFNRPAYAWYQDQVASGSPLDIIWHNDLGARYSVESEPLDKYYRGAEVASFRSAWKDKNALFIGFKAGDNKANHSNLDLGSFVLDALGVRWAEDLGSDDYNLPDYFGNKRWTYYRLRAEGHNTIVLNPDMQPDQDPRAAARIVRFESRPERAFAIADLTAAYVRNAAKAMRGITVLGRRQVLVQDEITAKQPAELWWFMHTQAKIALDSNGATATLSMGDKKLVAQILSPPDARFEVRDPVPLPGTPHPEKQAVNKGVKKLAIHLSNVTNACLRVQLTPQTGKTALPAAATQVPLERW